MRDLTNSLITIKKAFGSQDYFVDNEDYRDKLLLNPLVNGLFTVGPSFVIVANTLNWELELVTGNPEQITGYTSNEIYNMGARFILHFSIQEHQQFNMATVKACMEYSNNCPEEQRDFIFAVYFYHALKKNGELISIQHQSIPIFFDENKIPFVFCNVYSDISYLDAQNIPHGMMVNRFTNEVFHLNSSNFELEKRNEIFSLREKEIIRFLTVGLTSREIAEKLNISNDTVRTHRKNILNKAGINNTASLIKYSILNGVL